MVGGIVSEIYIALVVPDSADTTPGNDIIIMINAMSRLIVLDLEKDFEKNLDCFIGNKLPESVIN
jgi:hypothetical protein